MINQNLANIHLALKFNKLLIPVLEAKFKNTAFSPKAWFLPAVVLVNSEF